MRRISYSLTTPQFLDGTKDVTRRLGWRALVAGDRLMAVEKAMGLKKGEKHVELGVVEIVSVRLERLDAITLADVRREGFPDRDVAWFVAYFCKAMKCTPATHVNRIEFRRIG